MSNAEGIFGSGSGRSGHDPVTGILIAMRDAWLAGIGLKGNLCGQSMAGGNPGATLPAARERVNWCRNESHRSLTPGRVQPSRCRLRDALTITTSSSGARAVTNVGLPNVKNGVSTGTLIRPA